MVSLGHVSHGLIEPFLLVFQIGFDDTALHDVMEQFVARFGKNGRHGDSRGVAESSESS